MAVSSSLHPSLCVALLLMDNLSGLEWKDDYWGGRPFDDPKLQGEHKGPSPGVPPGSHEQVGTIPCR
jgi:hypothetical protein